MIDNVENRFNFLIFLKKFCFLNAKNTVLNYLNNPTKLIGGNKHAKIDKFFVVI